MCTFVCFLQVQLQITRQKGHGGAAGAGTGTSPCLFVLRLCYTARRGPINSGSIDSIVSEILAHRDDSGETLPRLLKRAKYM